MNYIKYYRKLHENYGKAYIKILTLACFFLLKELQN